MAIHDDLGRRASLRYSVSIPATLTADTSHACTLVNLSLGGASVLLARKLAHGDRVRVVFVVSDPRQKVEVMATVRWSADQTHGIQFDGMRAIEVWALVKFFERYRAPSRQQ